MDSAVVIVIIIAVVAVVAVVGYTISRRRTDAAPSEPAGGGPRLSIPLVEFRVRGDEAHVTFDVPLPGGDPDPVLGELLVREAVEVVRENRQQLSIGQVERIVAFGRRDGAEVQVGVIELDTPGELPPPVPPELLPKLHVAGFDPFEVLSDLQNAPGLAAASADGELPPLADELRLAGNVEAGLRTQGIDPAVAGAGDVVIGIMRLTGHAVEHRGDETYRVV